MDFELSQVLRWVIPLLIGIAATVGLYWLVGKTLFTAHRDRLYRQLTQVAVTLVALVSLILILPFDTETRGQLLSLFGLVVTAVIALSSTTFVSNAMAGVTLKVIGTFHTGDFIRVNDHFGRVRNKTLLHTEVQSEDRDTVTLPNMYLINNPVQVVEQTGTLISADVSIGYDVHRRDVREPLLRAAEAAGLKEPFVQILALGNFAIEYRITGFLEDVSMLVSKRTELHSLVVDELHAADIEVMTPSVMVQRPVKTETVMVPKKAPVQKGPDFSTGRPERIMFDKADAAARIEKIQEQCATLEAEIKTLEEEDKEANALEIAWRRHQLESQRAFLLQIEESGD